MHTRGILINRKSKVPLHRQLEAALRDAILCGTLSSGERLLSSREFQTHLGLSRNTILDALAQLHAEGFLVTRRGTGTFVAPSVQKRPANPSRARDTVLPSQRAAAYIAASPLAQNMQSSAPFRPGLPALDHFPSAQFKRAFRCGDWSATRLGYAGAFGHDDLRAAIARRLQQTRGIVCSPDQILISSGVQSAFSLTCRVLLDDRDLAVIENPGYSNVRAILLAFGVRIFDAPVDDAGIVVSSFQKRRAKLAYVTPSHQYPSGAVLSLDRRFALLAWAAEQDAWIIEDDYDSEFNYTDRPQPALQGLDNGERVIYLGTFSKVLSPALRIAYLVLPRALLAAFEAAAQVTGGPPDMFVQAALARFMENGHLGRHIVRMRKMYDQRRRFVSTELTGQSRGAFRIRDSRAGLHFVAELPPEIDDISFSKRAEDLGVIVPALSSYYHGGSIRNGIVVGYASTAIESAKPAVAALVSAL